MVASEDHLRPTDDKIPTGGPESGVLRTVLVPCTVILLGRWNWWPSRLSRVGAQPGGPGGPGGTGSTGNQVEGLSVIFILVMIVASSGRITPHSGHDCPLARFGP